MFFIMLEIITDPHLEKINIIHHAFFTRKGGVSEGCHSSLNCAYASLDNPDKVQENRRRAMQYLGSSLESLVTVKNYHSNKVILVEKPWTESEKPEADALVTQLPGIILGSDSADCPIILLADDQAKIIGLAHAGWKGAKAGIIEITVKKMISLGANVSNITASISPCIHQDSYEVSQEFYERFIEDENNKRYFRNAVRQNYFQFDLLAYVKDRLLILDLKRVSSEIAFDTYNNEDKFFSCRRAFHRGETDFGGHFSCIGLSNHR